MKAILSVACLLIGSIALADPPKGEIVVPKNGPPVVTPKTGVPLPNVRPRPGQHYWRHPHYGWGYWYYPAPRVAVPQNYYLDEYGRVVPNGYAYDGNGNLVPLAPPQPQPYPYYGYPYYGGYRPYYYGPYYERWGWRR